MIKLLIATRNQGKLAEIKKIFKDVDFEILSLDDIKEIDDFEPEENANSYKGNAVIKATAYGKKVGLLTIADDGGLEIDALDGRPGVNSARYAEGTDEDRYRKILAELEGVSPENRTCRYRCVAALYNPKTETVHTFGGVWEGRIVEYPRGNKSFGYAPIFLSPEYNFEKTNAELDPDETIKINHRGKAFRKAKKMLINNIKN
jgi:XTP/dITP diphosphohydrolase